MKIIERSHELDLEDACNDFLTKNQIELIDLHYSSSITSHNGQLEYTFSVLIVYK